MHHGAGTWSTHLVIVAPLVLLVRAPEPAEPAPSRDPEALLEEFKTMFRAVEEGGERTEQGGQRWPAG